MDLLNSIYTKSVYDNEINIRFWEDYLKSLQGLDFSIFAESLTIPIMVPVGSRILFRGALKHTNEITVAIGSDYFVKCSVKQAEILRQHRIKDAMAKLDSYLKEREYLQSQISFSKRNIYNTVGQEIVEEYNEDEDKIWRKKHKENMRQYKKQSKNIDATENITDEELWSRLEELELKEELEQELDNINNTVTGENIDQSSNEDTFEYNSDSKEYSNNIVNTSEPKLNADNKSDVIVFDKKSESISKLDLLQQVIERQNELEEKLQQIKQKEKTKIVSELDLISNLDKLDELDELEDEMNRLDDIISTNEDVTYAEDDSGKPSHQTLKRSVKFSDDDESETLEITFRHSNVLPSSAPYEPEKGFQKPSDIYAAFEKQFCGKTTSILKKKKYECGMEKKEITNCIQEQPNASHISYGENTIVIKDVFEKVDSNANMVIDTDARPTSLFKKKRLQSKFK